MSRAVFLRAVFAGFVALYPVCVYFGIRVLPPSFFGLLLALLILRRIFFIEPGDRRVVLPLMLLLFVYAIAAAIHGQPQTLLYYPVLVNFLLCALFAFSLWSEEPILLRFVRSRGKLINAHMPAYLRRLTGIWAVFFALNGMIALWTTTSTLEVWTVYNGLISYLLLGALVMFEWLFRLGYKRRHGILGD